MNNKLTLGLSLVLSATSVLAQSPVRNLPPNKTKPPQSINPLPDPKDPAYNYQSNLSCIVFYSIFAKANPVFATRRATSIEWLNIDAVKLKKTNDQKAADVRRQVDSYLAEARAVPAGKASDAKFVEREQECLIYLDVRKIEETH